MRLLLVMSLSLLAAMPVQADESRFARVCMNGQASGTGVCPLQPKPGKQPSDWACTRDDKTGLVWSLETGKGAWNYAQGAYPQLANQESRCGFTSGWRLPTRNELMTLLVRDSGPFVKFQALLDRNASGSQAAIDVRYFPGSQAEAYWTADSLAPDPSHAMFVYFRRGYDNTGNAYADAKSEDNFIRLVHSAR